MVAVETINDLPDVALLKVFSFCSQAELWKLRSVCWQWYNLLSDPNLWKVSDLSHFACDEINIFMEAMGYIPTNGIRFLESRQSFISNDVLCILLGLTRRLQGVQFVNCRFRQSPGKGEKLLFPIVGDLKVLDLRRSVGSSDFAKECLKQKKGIEILGLPNCVFAEEHHVVDIPWTYKGIRILELADCQWVDDTMISQIADASPNLESLNLYKCINIRGYTLNKLVSDCKNLKSLVLRRTSIRDESIDEPWASKSLTEIDISHCYYLDEPGTLNMVGTILPQLTFLCFAVTDKVLDHACSFDVLKLKTLELRRRYPVEIEKMVNMMSRCHELEVVDISLTPLDAKTMGKLLPNFPNLRWLSFAGHEILRTADTLQLLMLHCKKIESIGINYYHATNDCLLKSALLTMMAICKHLKTICLQGLWVVPIIQSIEETLEKEEMFANVRTKFCQPREFKLPMSELSVGKCVSRIKKEVYCRQ